MTSMTTLFHVGPGPDEFVEFHESFGSHAFLQHVWNEQQKPLGEQELAQGQLHSANARVSTNDLPRIEFPTVKRVKGNKYKFTGRWVTWDELADRNPLAISKPPDVQRFIQQGRTVGDERLDSVGPGGWLGADEERRQSTKRAAAEASRVVVTGNPNSTSTSGSYASKYAHASAAPTTVALPAPAPEPAPPPKKHWGPKKKHVVQEDDDGWFGTPAASVTPEAGLRSATPSSLDSKYASPSLAQRLGIPRYSPELQKSELDQITSPPQDQPPLPASHAAAAPGSAPDAIPLAQAPNKALDPNTASTSFPDPPPCYSRPTNLPKDLSSPPTGRSSMDSKYAPKSNSDRPRKESTPTTARQGTQTIDSMLERIRNVRLQAVDPNLAPSDASPANAVLTATNPSESVTNANGQPEKNDQATVPEPNKVAGLKRVHKDLTPPESTTRSLASRLSPAPATTPSRRPRDISPSPLHRAAVPTPAGPQRPDAPNDASAAATARKGKRGGRKERQKMEKGAQREASAATSSSQAYPLAPKSAPPTSAPDKPKQPPAKGKKGDAALAPPSPLGKKQKQKSRRPSTSNVAGLKPSSASAADSSAAGPIESPPMAGPSRSARPPAASASARPTSPQSTAAKSAVPKSSVTKPTSPVAPTTKPPVLSLSLGHFDWADADDDEFFLGPSLAPPVGSTNTSSFVPWSNSLPPPAAPARSPPSHQSHQPASRGPRTSVSQVSEANWRKHPSPVAPHPQGVSNGKKGNMRGGRGAGESGHGHEHGSGAKGGGKPLAQHVPPASSHVASPPPGSRFTDDPAWFTRPVTSRAPSSQPSEANPSSSGSNQPRPPPGKRARHGRGRRSSASNKHL